MNLKILTTTLLLVSVFTGCSDDKKETQEKQTNIAASSSGIEIVHNDNAKEIKVQEKENNNKDKAYYLGYGGVKSAYDPNSQPANKDASVRVKPRTTLDANLHVRSPYQEVQVSMLVNKLSKKFIVKCSACHSDYANGIIGPSLLGKDADYIFDKIAEFKSGKKSNPLMNDLINMMSEKEIRDMALEIYRFNTQLNEMRNK